MKRFLTAIYCAILTLTARAQAPVVQAHLQPAKDVLVGQPVRLTVTVYVPNYFTGSPDFPEFEMENAIVVLPQDRPENSNTEIGGVRYAGISETYVIYPQQAGDFHLPSAQITVPYAAVPPKTTTAHVPLPVLSFHADVPAAARDLDYFLPTTSLTVKESWSAPLTNLRAGDTVQRTITVTASKMQAMLIPPLPLEAPDGIRIYPNEPVVQDQKTDRGDFIFGRRTQVAKYFFQKPGDYTLPPIELKWWNHSTNHLVTAILPAVKLTAVVNPNYASELPPEPEAAPVAPIHKVSFWKQHRSQILIAAISVIVLLSLLWLGGRYLPSASRRVRAWDERRRNSEAACFRRLIRACNGNAAAKSYTSLLKWLSMTQPGTTLQEALTNPPNPKLTVEVQQLGATLFAKDSPENAWKGGKLASALIDKRKAFKSPSSIPRHLDDLNPTM